MENCKFLSTPLELNTNFEVLKEDEDSVDLNNYQSVIGCLIYASIGTRPDLLVSVGVMSKYMTKPVREH